MAAGTMDFEVKKPAESVALTARPVTPMELLQAAITQNLDTEKLAQLMELQLRWEANEARKAFVESMNAFKANPPQITKNKLVSFKDVKYKHATLDHACEAVTQSLSEHGISHRWRMDEDKPEWITVTCILTHKLGHSEETTFGGPPDNSGSKNAMQARASSVTYLQRYTLLAATGLAASDEDNDCNVSGMDDLGERLEWIQNCSTIPELQKIYAAAIASAKEAKDLNAIQQIAAAKDRRKKELQ